MSIFSEATEPVPTTSQEPETPIHQSGAASHLPNPEAALLAHEKTESNHPLYLTQREAADLLRVHINTIANKIKSGELPAFQMKGGRRILLARRDVLALLEPVINSGNTLTTTTNAQT